ncbi:MAG: hypothetical protein M1819_002796 [Sarea resinae]|nr:MAG: hypothetical protein M1819_002796 [Sarea resinae]
MTDAARNKATLHVAGIDNAVTTATLHAAFLPFGEIVGVTLPKPDAPSATEPHRGYGYIEFELPSDAREAMDNMDQGELYGRVIRVSKANPPKETNEGLGSRTAVWEQEGWLAKHAVSDEDRLAAETSKTQDGETTEDPMQGLEGLDVAGPRPE